MSAAQSQERVLEYTYLTLGGKDPETKEEYPAKWGMQYSLLVAKDQGHLPMAVIALETQKVSLSIINALENRGFSKMLGTRSNLSLSELFGGFFGGQQMGVLAGRSIKGAFLNAVTSSKQQLTWQGPQEMKKPSITGALLGGGGQQPQQTPLV